MNATKTATGFTVTGGASTSAPSQLSPEHAKALTWRNTDPAIRTGTACNCGSGTSAMWTEGGFEWLNAHVQNFHITGTEKMANVVAKIVTVPPLTDAQRAAIMDAINATTRNTNA